MKAVVLFALVSVAFSAPNPAQVEQVANLFGGIGPVLGGGNQPVSNIVSILLI